MDFLKNSFKITSDEFVYFLEALESLKSLTDLSLGFGK